MEFVVILVDSTFDGYQVGYKYGIWYNSEEIPEMSPLHA